MTQSTLHRSVMSTEVVEYLNVSSNLNYIDCTFGGGGHTAEILQRNGPKGRVLALDLDQEARVRASSLLKKAGRRLILAHENFAKLSSIVEQYAFGPINGILYDLGLSTDELKASGRGFSFQETEPLDMRFSLEQDLTAADIVNRWSEKDIADTIFEYGEERYARRIARNIVEGRKKQRILSTTDLAGIIGRSIPPPARHGRIHYATRTFQALRIAVNDELSCLSQSLAQAIELCAPQGRIVVISFHSLEDRIVKQFFRRVTQEKRGTTLTKRPLTPSLQEQETNPASRSAKLRAWEKHE